MTEFDLEGRNIFSLTVHSFDYSMHLHGKQVGKMYRLVINYYVNALRRRFMYFLSEDNFSFRDRKSQLRTKEKIKKITIFANIPEVI